jgi:hypothetical protein
MERLPLRELAFVQTNVRLVIILSAFLRLFVGIIKTHQRNNQLVTYYLRCESLRTENDKSKAYFCTAASASSMDENFAFYVREIKHINTYSPYEG